MMKKRTHEIAGSTLHPAHTPCRSVRRGIPSVNQQDSETAEQGLAITEPVLTPFTLFYAERIRSWISPAREAPGNTQGIRMKRPARRPTGHVPDFSLRRGITERAEA